MRYWVKEEILDLHAILESIKTKENLESLLTKTWNKKRSCQANLDKLNQGKKTITNFWKSSSAKANSITQYTQTIAQCEIDITNYEWMINVVAANLSENAIPQFKKDKSLSYFKILKATSEAEGKNYTAGAKVWMDLLQMVEPQAQEK